MKNFNNLFIFQVPHQEEKDQFWIASNGNLIWICSRTMHVRYMTVTKMSVSARVALD